VTTLDIAIDSGAPASTLIADPATIWPPNGKDVTVTLTGTATDAGPGGLTSISFRVIDEYGDVQPAISTVVATGQASLPWERSVVLQASRRGDDKDGRTYTIEATITDRACNTKVVTATVTVLHDQGHGGQ
jgi:hypothetical protein